MPQKSDCDRLFSDTVNLAADLIRRPSITPWDAGCQDVMTERLQAIGFNVSRLRFADVDNFWASHGQGSPTLVFAGHTDVVPTGPEEQWTHPPFAAHIEDGIVHGRGAADMKGSLAAMVTAAERFIEKHPDHAGEIGFLITSDEEGPAVHGTRQVMEYLHEQGIELDYCIIGEPSSTHQLGDIIKNGRRGSLSGELRILGRQGHVAYPHLALNPVPLAARFIDKVSHAEWDDGNEYFPPTTFQISNIQAGTGATNVIPGHVEIQFNFRFSPESTPEHLKAGIAEILNQLQLDYEIEWNLSGMPFETGAGELLTAISASILEVVGIETEPSTTGGTSDGRFIAPYGVQVVELGPCNATIHKVDEQVLAKDLDTLSEIYERAMKKLLT